MSEIEDYKPRMMPAQKPHRSKQDYSTPRIFLDAVERRFGKLDFDLAATDDNRVVRSYYGPGSRLGLDSLKQDWRKLRGNLWLNPEFGSVAPWASKCRETSQGQTHGRKIFFLVPASIGSNWFAAHVWGYSDVWALKGRLSFDGKASYPKDCMICIYGRKPGFGIWDWRSP